MTPDLARLLADRALQRFVENPEAVPDLKDAIEVWLLPWIKRQRHQGASDQDLRDRVVRDDLLIHRILEEVEPIADDSNAALDRLIALELWAMVKAGEVVVTAVDGAAPSSSR